MLLKEFLGWTRLSFESEVNVTESISTTILFTEIGRIKDYLSIGGGSLCSESGVGSRLCSLNMCMKYKEYTALGISKTFVYTENSCNSFS